MFVELARLNVGGTPPGLGMVRELSLAGCPSLVLLRSVLGWLATGMVATCGSRGDRTLVLTGFCGMVVQLGVAWCVIAGESHVLAFVGTCNDSALGHCFPSLTRHHGSSSLSHSCVLQAKALDPASRAEDNGVLDFVPSLEAPS